MKIKEITFKPEPGYPCFYWRHLSLCNDALDDFYHGIDMSKPLTVKIYSHPGSDRIRVQSLGGFPLATGLNGDEYYFFGNVDRYIKRNLPERFYVEVWQ